MQDEIKKLNPQTQVLVQRVDVTSEADVDAAFNKAVETFGTVDVAIHNAGLNKSTANLAETALDSWWSHFVRLLFLSPLLFFDAGSCRRSISYS